MDPIENLFATADEIIAKLRTFTDSKQRAYAVAIVMSHLTEEDPEFITHVATILSRSLGRTYDRG